MAQIMTLCERCEKELLNSLFKVKPVPTMAMTTEKTEFCQWCHQSFPEEKMKLMTIKRRSTVLQSRRRRKHDTDKTTARRRAALWIQNIRLFLVIL